MDDGNPCQGLYAPGAVLGRLSPEVLRSTNQVVLALDCEHDQRITERLRSLNHTGVVAPLMSFEIVKRRSQR